MSNDKKTNVYERLWKLWAMICKMIMDGVRDPEKVAVVLQKIIDEAVVDIIVAIESERTELWLAPGQDIGRVRGWDILNHLSTTRLLDGCIDRVELANIQAKDVNFYRKHFRGKAVYGWRGVQNELVPYLVEFNNSVVLRELHLDNYWRCSDPCLRLT